MGFRDIDISWIIRSGRYVLALCAIVMCNYVKYPVRRVRPYTLLSATKLAYRWSSLESILTTC